MVDSATVPNEVQGPIAPVVPDPPAVPDKFKNEDGTVNTEALVSSYHELEGKLGKPGGEPKAGEKTADEKLAEEKTAADKAKDDDDTKYTYGEAVDKALDSVGMSAKGVFNEYTENGGKLTETTYGKLTEAGYSREIVDQYILNAQVAESVDTTNQATSIKEVKDSVGGEDAYMELMRFASSLPKVEQDTYNHLMDMDDKNVALAAVSAMRTKYEEAEGKEGKILLGGSKPSADVFQSSVELTKAMQDARATGDPAKIKAVEQKALRSNVFA